MKKHNGFTLLELLVVIAIISIMATVSIIGYTSFVNKAKYSNDNYLISQLNGYVFLLKIDGSNIDTVSDINKYLIKDGIDLGKVKVHSDGYYYGYDALDKIFLLFNEFNHANKDEIYVFVSDIEEMNNILDKAVSTIEWE